MKTTALAVKNEDLWEALAKSEENLPAQTQKELQCCHDWCKNREWFSEENERAFYDNLKALVLSLYNGDDFQTQARHYKAECFDIMDADRADRALDLLKSMNLIKKKEPFMVAKPKGRTISIRGKGDHDWKVIPVGDFRQTIPLEVLETLTRLRQEGMAPDGFGIAEAVQRVRVVRDPILLARFGRYWVRISQWE